MENAVQSGVVQSDAKERLLTAALDQFTKRGYASTTVRELCEAAGVTKPVLYYYFKNKEGLYLELMDSSYSLFEATIVELTSYSGTSNECLRHFCQGIYDISCQHRQVVQLCFSIYYGPPQGAPEYDLDSFYTRMLDEMAKILQKGILSGEIRDCSTSDMAWSILALMNVAIEEQLSPREPRIDGAAMNRMIQLLFEGIKAK